MCIICEDKDTHRDIGWVKVFGVWVSVCYECLMGEKDTGKKYWPFYGDFQDGIGSDERRVASRRELDMLLIGNDKNQTKLI